MTWSLTHYFGSRFTLEEPKPILVMISGWSLRSEIFEMLLPGLTGRFDIYLAEYQSITEEHSFHSLALDLEQQIAAITDQPYWLLGFSLGGNIALSLASAAKVPPEGLILIGVNPCFIALDDWPYGIAAEDFDNLYLTVEQDIAKGLKQFDFLQTKGDVKQKTLTRALREFRKEHPVSDKVSLLNALKLLKHQDLRKILQTLRVPTVWILGRNDALVPHKLKEYLNAHNSYLEVTIVGQAGHLGFLSQPEIFFDKVNQLHQRVAHEREKVRMAERFSKAASTYDSFSELQQRVGQKLYQSLPDRIFDKLLDAGCGTGFWSEKLLAKTRQLISLDLAEGMLAYSKKMHPGTGNQVQGDIEHLPFKAGSIDGIFSNLATQWIEHLESLLNNLAFVLSDGGEIFISTLGPGTLLELRKSFEALDQYQHVNLFPCVDDLVAAIAASGMTLVNKAESTEVIYYTEPVHLLKDLKGIGASLVKRGGVKGLMGQRKLQALFTAYETFKTDEGLYPASYEVIYLHIRAS